MRNLGVLLVFLAAIGLVTMGVSAQARSSRFIQVKPAAADQLSAGEDPSGPIAQNKKKKKHHADGGEEDEEDVVIPMRVSY